MTYYLERFTRTMGNETLTLAADSDDEAIIIAKRLHEPRIAASGAILWNNAHVAVATLGASDGRPGATRHKNVNEIKPLNSYYGNLFNDMDGDKRRN